MKFRTIHCLFLLLLCFQLGCDRNKSERQALQAELENQKATLLPLQAEHDSNSAKYSQCLAAVENYRADMRQNDSEYEKNKLELAKYCMEHKMATLAMAAGGSGIWLTVQEDTPEGLRNASKAALAAGVGYCLFNASECAEVATRIAYYGSQMKSFTEKNEALAKRANSQKAACDALDQERHPLAEKLSKRQSDLTALRERIESLKCKGWLCF